ncbi:MAG: hypothetical protein QCH35_03190 [Methanomicrobiaceae archaeon]|nr:hypothetical protein [Methanomicrobiaceae archaeon]
MNKHDTASESGVVHRIVGGCACSDREVALRIGLACDAVGEHMKRKLRGEMIDVSEEYGPVVDLAAGAAHAGGDVAAALGTLFPCEVQPRRLLA